MLAEHLKLLSQMLAIAVAGGLMYLLPRFYQNTIQQELQQVQKTQTCLICRGAERVPCLMCGGKGERIVLTTTMLYGGNDHRNTRPPICESCNGSGKAPCAACRRK